MSLFFLSPNAMVSVCQIGSFHQWSVHLFTWLWLSADSRPLHRHLSPTVDKHQRKGAEKPVKNNGELWERWTKELGRWRAFLMTNMLLRDNQVTHSRLSCFENESAISDKCVKTDSNVHQYSLEQWTIKLLWKRASRGQCRKVQVMSASFYIINNVTKL